MNDPRYLRGIHLEPITMKTSDGDIRAYEMRLQWVSLQTGEAAESEGYVAIDADLPRMLEDLAATIRSVIKEPGEPTVH